MGSKAISWHPKQVSQKRWPKPAVLLMIETYRSFIPSNYAGKFSPKRLWKQIANTMNDNGYEFTILQCNQKFKSLKKTYQSCKTKYKTNTGKKPDWQYYELMDEILKTNPWSTTVFSYTGEAAIPTKIRLSRKSCNYADGVQWPRHAVLLFLKLYELFLLKFMQHNYCSHNKLWEEIAAKMNAEGYDYTSKQCADKFISLKRQYKVCKKHNVTNANENRFWQYYDLMEDIFNKSARVVSSTSESTPDPSSEESTTQTSYLDLEFTSIQAARYTGSLRSMLENLIILKEQRETDRQKKHCRRMESDEKLYRILESLVTK